MADEAPLLLPIHQHVAQVHAPPLPTPGAEVPAPTVEQARNADQVFASKRESDEALALLGMQAGILMLHDLACEHFDRPEDEEDKKKPGAPPDPDKDER
jgi:hypothetical protein